MSLNRWFAFFFGTPRTVRKTKHRRPSRRLCVELLEDRTQPSVSVVSTAATVSNTAAGTVAGPASVSQDGRYVVYTDNAANLSPSEVMNPLAPIIQSNSGPGVLSEQNVYLFNRGTGDTTLISHVDGKSAVTANGTSENPVISADGKWIAFVSNSDNLISGLSGGGTLSTNFQVYLYEVATGDLTLVSHLASDQGTGYQLALSDGSSGIVPLVASNSAASVTSVSISKDGSYLTYVSTGSHLEDGQEASSSASGVTSTPANVFVYDRSKDTNFLISASTSTDTNSDGAPTTPGNDTCFSAAIDQNGDTIAYYSLANDLVAGETDPNSFPAEQAYVAIIGSTWATATVSLMSHDGSDVTTASTYSITDLNDYPTPVLTPDGHFIAYLSVNENIGVQGNTGPSQVTPSTVKGENVYLYDTHQPTTLGNNLLVSHTPGNMISAGNGDQGAGGFFSTANASTGAAPALSDDGRFVAFVNNSTDLTSAGTSSGYNVYLFDRESSASTTTVQLITNKSIPSSAIPSTAIYPPLAPTISGDGRYVGYVGIATGDISGLTNDNGSSGLDALLYDQGTNPGTSTPTYMLLSHDFGSTTTTGNGSARAPVFSDDGSTVLYLDQATNLIPTTISGSSSYDFRSQGTQETQDTAYDAFGLFAYNLTTPSTYTPVAGNADNDTAAQGTNSAVTLRDPKLASGTANGQSEIAPQHAISDDGTYLVYASTAPNLVSGESLSSTGTPTENVYLYNRTTNTTTLISRDVNSTSSDPIEGDGASFNAVISGDGSTVVFFSTASNLLSGVTVTSGTVQLYEYTLASDSLTLLTYAAGSTTQASDGDSPSLPPNVVGSPYINTLAYSAGSAASLGDIFGLALPSISSDGKYVAFISSATNLVANESNSGKYTNVYLYDGISGSVTLVSHAAGKSTTVADNSTGGGAWASTAAISADGSTIAFTDPGTDLISGQNTDGVSDQLYVWSRIDDSTTGLSAGETVLASHTASDSLTGATIGNDPSGNSLAGSFGYTQDSPPSLSKDGTAIAYYFAATDLVSGQGGQASYLNVFLYHNLPSSNSASNTNELVSHIASDTATAGDNPEQQIAYSANGFITGQLGPFEANGPQISADGKYIAYANNSSNLLSTSFTNWNGADNVYWYDNNSADGTSYRTNRLVSHAAGSATTPDTGGGTAPSSISANDRYVTFLDYAYPASTPAPLATSSAANVRLFDAQATATTQPAAVGLAFDSGTDLIALSAVLGPTVMSATTPSDATTPIIAWDGLAADAAAGTADINNNLDVFLAFTSALKKPSFSSDTGSATFVYNDNSSSFTVKADGNPKPTYSVTTGNLPTGMSLDTNSGVIGGAPTQSGSTTVVITASNSQGTATFTLTIKVDRPPTSFTNGQVPALTFGTAMQSFQFTTHGYPDPSFSVTQGSLPGGLSLSSGGLLTGTPTQGGQTTFTITADNSTSLGGSTASQQYTITVNQTPSLPSQTVSDFTFNQQGSYTFQVNGYPSPSFTITGGTLPGGLNLSNGGILSGTPTQSGQFTFTVTAHNGIGQDASQQFSFNVNQQPSIPGQSVSDFTFNQQGSYTFQVNGYPPPNFTVTGGTLPGGLNLSNGGTLSGKPTQGGQFTFTIKASNSSGSSSQQFTINVDQTPNIPDQTVPDFTFQQQGSYTFTVNAYPLPSFSFSGNLPPGLSLSNSGVLSGTPTQSGQFPFSITATNSQGSSGSQSVTVTVNQAPSIPSQTVPDFTFGQQGSFKFTANGYPLPTFGLSSGSFPPGLTLASDGTLSGKPTQGGQFTFTFSASNSQGSANSQSITVNVNQTPSIPAQTVPDFTFNQFASYTFETKGYPLPSLTVVSGSLPPGLTLDPPTGTLSGTPSQGGQYTFTIKASNSQGSANSQTITVNVNQPPTILTTDVIFAVGLSNSITIATTGFPVPSIALDINSNSLPSWLSLNGAVLSGTPPTAGTFSINLIATNSAGSSLSTPIKFTITNPQPPQITTADITPFTVGASNSFSFSAIGDPPPAFSSTNLPAGLNLLADGTLTGTPTDGSGTYRFTVRAKNSLGVVSQDYSLTVLEAPTIGTISATWTVNQSNSVAINTSGFPAPNLAFVGGSSPYSWLSLSAGDLLGNPPAAGTYTFDLVATSTVGSDTETFSLKVVNPPPEITNSPTATFVSGPAGASNSFTFVAVGDPGTTFSSPNLPAGLNLTLAGVLTGTPTAHHTVTFTVEATGADGQTTTQDFTLKIVPAPQLTAPIHYYSVNPSEGTATIGQKSIIRHIQLRFNQPVFLDPGAISVQWLSGPGGVQAGSLVALSIAGNGTNTITLSFSGALTQFGSLVDGNYQLDVNADGVHAGGQTGPALAASISQKFFRFFGDSNGDRSVNATDLATFKAVRGRRPGHGGKIAVAFDFTGTGNLLDPAVYMQFKRRLGHHLKKP